MSRRPTVARASLVRKRALALLLSAVGLGGVGCDSGPAGEPDGSGGIAAELAANRAKGVPTVLDEAGLRTLLEAKRGTPLLLNMWAMWCGPCVAELPHLQAAAKAHAAEGLEVLALNLELMAPGTTVEDTVADVPGFLAERGIDLPILVYSEEDVGPLADWFDVSIALPVTAVIRPDGSVVNTHQGFATEAEFHTLAEQALGAPVAEDR